MSSKVLLPLRAGDKCVLTDTGTATFARAIEEKRRNRYTVAECLDAIGEAIDAFDTPFKASKTLPERPEYLTFEDDAYDLGKYHFAQRIDFVNGRPIIHRYLVKEA